LRWHSFWQRLATMLHLAPAARDLHAGLSALSSTLTANPRFFWALVILLVCAPLVSVSYLAFDPHHRVSGWYYLNLYYFLLTTGPYLYLLTSMVGIFLLFPGGSSRGMLLILPAGFTTAKIIWLCTVTNNADFHRIVPASFLVLGMLTAGTFFMCLGWITHRRYHQYDGIIARILGLNKLTNITEQQRRELMAAEIDKLRAFHQL
jgi:hypothetical protein